MPYHVIYTYYQQTGRGPTGWSETFWNDALSSEVATSQALSLGVLLRNVHSKNALMQTISVRLTSNDPAAKTTRRVSFTSINETLTAASGRLKGMYPTTALRLLLRDMGGRSNYVWLRGMPDDIDIEGNFERPLLFVVPINQLVAELVDPDKAWVRRELREIDQKIPVQNVTNLGVVTALAHGMLANYRVRLGRTSSKPNVDGVYRVGSPVTADTFPLINFPVVDGNIQIFENSYVLRQFYQTDSIAAAIPNAVSKKNVGRPSGSPAGRQKTPKS